MRIIGVDENYEVAKKYGAGELVVAKNNLKKLLSNNKNMRDAIVAGDWGELINLIESAERDLRQLFYVCAYCARLLASIDVAQAELYITRAIKQPNLGVFMLYGFILDNVEIYPQPIHCTIRCCKIKTIDWYLPKNEGITKKLLDEYLFRKIDRCVIDNLIIHVSDITANHMSEQELLDYLSDEDICDLEVKQIKMVEN